MALIPSFPSVPSEPAPIAEKSGTERGFCSVLEPSVLSVTSVGAAMNLLSQKQALIRFIRFQPAPIAEKSGTEWRFCSVPEPFPFLASFGAAVGCFPKTGADSVHSVQPYAKLQEKLQRNGGFVPFRNVSKRSNPFSAGQAWFLAATPTDCTYSPGKIRSIFAIILGRVGLIVKDKNRTKTGRTPAEENRANCQLLIAILQFPQTNPFPFQSSGAWRLRKSGIVPVSLGDVRFPRRMETVASARYGT
jgi:hypothetical protein